MTILCTTLRMYSLSKRCSDVELDCDEGGHFYFKNRNDANYNSFNALMQTLTTLEHYSQTHTQDLEKLSTYTAIMQELTQ